MVLTLDQYDHLGGAEIKESPAATEALTRTRSEAVSPGKAVGSLSHLRKTLSRILALWHLCILVWIK